MLNKDAAVATAYAIATEVGQLTETIDALRMSLEDADTVTVNEGGEQGYRFASDENDADELSEAIARRKVLARRFESDELSEDAMTPEAFEAIGVYYDLVARYC